jgi:hypothetical protein
LTIIDLLMLSAATWYLSFALTNTDGPGSVFEWIREHVWHGRRKGVEKSETSGIEYPMIQKNGLLDCIVCLSIWIALLLALLTGHTVLDGIAVAGVSLWVHGFTGWRYNVS